MLLMLNDLCDWPTDLPIEGRRFSLFMVMDGRDVAEDACRVWNAFADRAIEQGLAYLCTWGPNCELLHDLMDETLVERETRETQGPSFTMTTWHADESLEEALEFFRDCAIDPELQDVSNAPGIVVLVGRPELAGRIEAFAFNRFDANRR